jgi:hypothetical protein
MSEHRILRIAEILRKSGLSDFFKNGQCYNFFLLCHAVDTRCECWGDDDHVYARLGNSLFDIDGIHPVYEHVYHIVTEPRIFRGYNQRFYGNEEAVTAR